MTNMKTLAPGSTIGMLGGGQLGRMLALAAAKLGFKVHVFTNEIDGPTGQVSNAVTHADYHDKEALLEFAKQVDVVTYEFENIPVETVSILSEVTSVFPDARVLEVVQDRLTEKKFINSLGIATAPFKDASTVEEAREALKEIGYPAVLKTRRFGYDGKGQAIVKSEEGLEDAWRQLNNDRIIIEKFIPFDLEISVVAARGQDGEVVCFSPVENDHKNHILDLSIAPARVENDILNDAISKATKIINDIKYVGVMTAEFFVTKEGPVLRVNEIAPRVHNSGHWTIEACRSSQFEQHIRAVCGLPLGCVNFIGEARMTNLIGDDILQYDDLLQEKGANVHHYGKNEIRAGRKMGHVTRLFPIKK